MGRIVEGDYVGSATVGPKGQIVLPVLVRKVLNLHPGDKVLLYMRPDKGHVKVIKAQLVTALMNKAMEEIVDLGKLMESLNKKSTKH
jgi:AbrB family looped-hinge helix DNA binding protein